MKNELWDSQLFQNDLGLLLGQFHDDFTKGFNNLHKSQWKNNMYKLVNLDMTQVHERSVDKITSIEECLRENARLLLLTFLLINCQKNNYKITSLLLQLHFLVQLMLLQTN